METAMTNKVRNTSGKFAPKSEVPRKVRSVNLTDTAWQWLADVATQSGVSRNDYLEAMAERGIPFMETVSSEISPLIETVETEKKVDSANTAQQPNSEISPFMETVSHALTTPEEALANAKIYGFTPEEALADAHFQIAMLQSNHDELEDSHEAVKREYATLLESSTAVTNKLRQELAEVRSQLATERADRKAIKNSAPIAIAVEFPEPAVILSQLRTKRKKSKADLADIEAILELLES